MRKSLGTVPVLLLFAAIGAPPAFADLLNPMGTIAVGTSVVPLQQLQPGQILSATYSLQTTDGLAVGTGAADLMGPFVDVQGETHGAGGFPAFGSVSYYTQISSLAAGLELCAGGCAVPVEFKFQLQATASASGSLVSAFAYASSLFNADGHANADRLGGSETMKCTSNGCTFVSTTPMTTGVAFVNASSGLSDPILITVEADGNVGGACTGVIVDSPCQGRSNGTFLALADPIVQIADELIPGANINYRDAFSLSFSPGVVQGVGNVPEAATGGLMLLGIAFVSLMRKVIA